MRIPAPLNVGKWGFNNPFTEYWDDDFRSEKSWEWPEEVVARSKRIEGHGGDESGNIWGIEMKPNLKHQLQPWSQRLEGYWDCYLYPAEAEQRMYLTVWPEEVLPRNYTYYWIARTSKAFKFSVSDWDESIGDWHRMGVGAWGKAL